MSPLPPLRHRLANPPAVFIGRSAELARLADALERNHLVYIWGMGGVGKSSLVSSGLHRDQDAESGSVVVVDVRPGDDITSVLVAAASAMAARPDGPTLDARSVLGDIDAVVTHTLQIAEHGTTGWTVVIDNLHHAIGEVARALDSVARYARSSRWIAISRAAPPDVVDAAQVLEVGTLPQPSLVDLAQVLAPELTEQERLQAVDASGGSPWRLKQLIAGRVPCTEPGSDPVLESLDEDTRAFLRAMAVVEVSLPLALAAQFADRPADETVEALERRGIVERGPAGYRVHDVTRSLLQSTGNVADTKTRERVAQVLATQDELSLVVEGLRIALALGVHDRALEALDRHGKALLSPAYLLAVGPLLRSVTVPELYPWCLAFAVESGDAGAVARLGAPGPGAPASHLLLRARGLRLQGELDAARGQAAKAGAAARDAGNHEVHAAAHRFEVQCAMASSDYAAARELLESFEPRELYDRLSADIYKARCAVELDDDDDARRLARHLQQWSSVLDGDALRHFGFELATALHHCGELREADELMARAAAPLAGSPLVAHCDRLTMEVVAFLATERGRLDAAKRTLEQIPGGSPFVRLFSEHIDAARRLYAGDLTGLDTAFEQLHADSMERADAVASALGLGWRMASMRAQMDVSNLEQRTATLPDTPRFRMARLCRDELHARRGGAAELASQWVQARDPAIRAQARIAAALATSARDPAGAVELARGAVKAADSAGFGALEASALVVLCDVSFAARDVEGTRAAAQRLSRLAQAMPSERLLAHARLFDALCGPDSIAPRAFELLAAAPDVSPVACRRARALLGGSVALDAIDARVVAVARERAAPWRVVSGRDEGWGHGIMVDERSRRVWLPEKDAPVALDRNPLLWRLLVELARPRDHGRVGVGKEQLVCAVWDVVEYHPLRHDNKLHAAVKNLRKRIELEPARPTRVLTTDEGYRLGSSQPVRRIAHGRSES